MRSRTDAAPSLIFVPELSEASARIRLPEDEAHYVTRVCRLRAGDAILATDGHGALATGDFEHAA